MSVSNIDLEDNNLLLKKTWFIQKNKEKIDYYYDINYSKTIGYGTYSKVFKGISKATGQVRAIKRFSKKRPVNLVQFQNETKILTKLDHPYIIKIFEVYEDNNYCYIVLEYCKGGELLDHIIDNGPLFEEQAKIIFFQIISAIKFCHSNNIVHRDLKLENILYINKQHSSIKLIDFGWAKEIEDSNDIKEEEQLLYTKIGTPFYIAPEVLFGKYTKTVDI